MPGGVLRAPGGDRQLRTMGEAKRPEQLEAVVVRALPDGTVLTLGQIADVRETFQEFSFWGRYNGKPAVDVIVQKREEEDAIKIADAVRQHIDGNFSQSLPPQIQTGLHSDLSKYIRQRIDLMTRNGIMGLILVFLSLTFFLSLRVSIWVAAGSS